MKDEIKTNPDCDFILRKDAIDLCTRFIEGEPRGWVKRAIREVQTSLLALSPIEPTTEEVWGVAQKVFNSTLTYREAVDYLKELEKQHERFNQQNRCD